MLKPGKILCGIHRYKILEFMQSGGFSDLYMGLDLTTNRRVVIKNLLNKKFDDEEQAEDYLRRERAFIDIQSRFSMNALKLSETLIKKDRSGKKNFYIITNLIKGEDFNIWFQELIDRNIPKLYTYLVRNILYPLSQYFSFCHNHGVLHRDISLGNILIINKPKSKPIPVVIDFGAALNFDPGLLYKRPVDLYDLLDSEEDYIFTEGFNPPEIDEKKSYLPQSDIYSFGALMFYCFTFGNEREEANYYDDYELDPKEFNPDCPEFLRNMVIFCTRYQPADRYLSFDHINLAFKEFLANNRSKKSKSSKKTEMK